MNLLQIRFAVFLDYRPFEGSPFHPHGALFTRWLPNGKNDAIEICPQTHLSVWFDRFGFVGDRGFALFDIERRDLDPSAISRQGRLESGPLLGSLEVSVDDSDLASLRDQRRGDERYVRLGKRVVKELILPHIKRFLGTLRTEYGQYWIAEPGDWDRRTQSLGSYCSKLQMKWSTDGKQWEKFVPDDPVQHIVASLRSDFDEYLSERHWRELQNRREWAEVTEGARMLTRAHESFDQNDLKNAFIDGVTALELSLDEYLRNRLSHRAEILSRVEAFTTINLPAKMIVLAASLVDKSVLDGGLTAIETRNRIIHEGWNPDPEAAKSAVKLLRIVSALLGWPRSRFPSADSRNKIF